MKHFLFICVLPFYGLFTQDDNIYSTWILDFNNSFTQEHISNHYDSKAFVDYLTGIGNQETITNQCSSLKNIIGTIDSVIVLGETRGRSGNKMTIGLIKAKNREYAILSSFKKTKKGMVREYEIIRPFKFVATLEDDPVKSQRIAWQNYSNAHTPDILINQVYATQSKYLNQGKLFQGKSSITEEYAYMKGKSWSITLTKKHLLRVNKNLIFEIGTYQSNGFGQYLLVWELSSEGKWEILLDSNF